MKASHLLLTTFALAATFSIHAQDYPYDDANSDSAASLPVEVPNPSTPSQRVPKKATSLFRMGLKGGANFTSFQDRVCTSADPTSGCTSYVNRSFSGPGYEGHIGFGWDLAYQPVYIETELAYLQKLINLATPLRVFQIQQGLYHRTRIGQDTLWKNGILAVLDIRVAQTSDADLSAAAYPAIGFSSLIEWGAFLTQLNVYLSELRSAQNHFSASFDVGVRF